MNKYDDFVNLDLPELYIVTGDYQKAIEMLDNALDNIKSIANKKHSEKFLKLVWTFLSWVAVKQSEKYRDAEDEALDAFLEVEVKYKGEVPFGIEKLLRYMEISDEEKEEIKQVGRCFL